MKIASIPILLVFACSIVAGQAPDETAPASRMRVAALGVGTGVEARKLVGKADAFPEGSRVWFWTRIVGGTEGDRVRHVWLREGKEVFSIGLAIGGDQWRTYSNKTMHVGAAGNWVAEVRTSDDRVLARQEFRCTSAD